MYLEAEHLLHRQTYMNIKPTVYLRFICSPAGLTLLPGKPCLEVLTSSPHSGATHIKAVERKDSLVTSAHRQGMIKYSITLSVKVFETDLKFPGTLSGFITVVHNCAYFLLPVDSLWQPKPALSRPLFDGPEN